mmetsp:Transcript_60072/g.166285  ORF Transcript_60072/g.166285 Transcript_60072/m.166285 type:complete len:205 (-) Transcript_60072:130-744(-)
MPRVLGQHTGCALLKLQAEILCGVEAMRRIAVLVRVTKLPRQVMCSGADPARMAPNAQVQQAKRLAHRPNCASQSNSALGVRVPRAQERNGQVILGKSRSAPTRTRDPIDQRLWYEHRNGELTCQVRALRVSKVPHHHGCRLVYACPRACHFHELLIPPVDELNTRAGPHLYLVDASATASNQLARALRGQEEAQHTRTNWSGM